MSTWTSFQLRRPPTLTRSRSISSFWSTLSNLKRGQQYQAHEWQLSVPTVTLISPRTNEDILLTQKIFQSFHFLPSLSKQNKIYNWHYRKIIFWKKIKNFLYAFLSFLKQLLIFLLHDVILVHICVNQIAIECVYWIAICKMVLHPPTLTHSFRLR